MVRERLLDSVDEEGFSDITGNEEVDTVPINLLKEWMRCDLIERLILLSDGIRWKPSIPTNNKPKSFIAEDGTSGTE